MFENLLKNLFILGCLFIFMRKSLKYNCRVRLDMKERSKKIRKKKRQGGVKGKKEKLRENKNKAKSRRKLQNHIFLREIWKKTNKNPKNKALWGKTIKILQQKQTKLMEVWKMKLRQFPRKWSLETRWEKSKIRGSGPHRNLKRREPWSEREELPLRSSG